MSIITGEAEAGQLPKRRKTACEKPKIELSLPLDENCCSIAPDVPLTTHAVIVIAMSCVMALGMLRMAFEDVLTAIGKSRTEPAYTGELRVLLPYGTKHH
jgi:hypothetical protein